MTHYGVQVRIFLDSVGDNIQENVNRGYSLRVMEDGSSSFFTKADGLADSTPIGFMALDTSEALSGHSAGLSLLVGYMGEKLRGLIECQDCLRIEANAGDGFRCLFDGFISGVSWSKTATPQGFSWRLQVRAEGLHKIFQQLWMNWIKETTAGAWDQKTKDGLALLDKLQLNTPFTPPQLFIGLMLDYGVSNLMNLTGRDGKKVQRGGMWQLGNFGAPDLIDTQPLWHNAMDLGVPFAATSYLQMEGSLWHTLQSITEPELHEFFITYAPSAGSANGEEIPTVVFRPIPFPGPAKDPTSTRVDPRDTSGNTMLPGPGLPSDVSYPDDNEWNGLQVLTLGGDIRPGPISVSSSKSDGGRKNMFSWSMASAMDGSPARMYSKSEVGYYLDLNSVNRYGFSCDQVTTSVYDKNSTDWLSQQIPRVLARVAFQRAPLPYLWNQQRNYALIPGARAGTVLEDSTDGVCGYITSVSHQITSGVPGQFHAATTITVERVAEDCTAKTYPDKVRSFVWGLEKQTYLESDAQRIAQDATTAPSPKAPNIAHGGGFIRKSPTDPSGGTLPAVTTPFGGSTKVRKGTPHLAADYAVTAGTQLYSPCNGTILARPFQPKGLGYWVQILGDDGSLHNLGHFQSACTLTDRSSVKAGDPLALSGHSGNTYGPTGDHLHWQVFLRNNRAIDPAKWLANGGADA